MEPKKLKKLQKAAGDQSHDPHARGLRVTCCHRFFGQKRSDHIIPPANLTFFPSCTMDSPLHFDEAHHIAAKDAAAKEMNRNAKVSPPFFS